MAYCKWFKQISKKDVPVAGGKGANLGEMFNAGFPVPPGFVVTTNAYREFLREKKLDKKIAEKLSGLDIEDTDRLQEVAKEVQELILNGSVSNELREEISEFYQYIDTAEELRTVRLASQLLKNGRDPAFVAVRSSASAEDLPGYSFAGQQATLLNVKGTANVVRSVQECWASLFTARAIYYREKNNFNHMKVFIAVVVQKQINSEKSGVVFTINPSTNDATQIVIESAWGLGEAVVSGAVNPNTYVLKKETGQILDRDIPGQTWMFTRDEYTGANIKKNIPKEKQKAQVLSDAEIKTLWKLAIEDEEHYNFPQDIEFAIERGKVYLVQTRPVTTLEKKEELKVETTEEPILMGLGASPGHATGPVKIVLMMTHLDKIQKGDILVTTMTTPDFVPAMQKASAIITDHGGMTAHASIVSREMGIPCVVGTKSATHTLKDGDIVTVDGTAGKVFKGTLKLAEHEETQAELRSAVPSRNLISARVSKPDACGISTQTKVKVIMDLPEFAERAAETCADGIGLLRIEGIIASGRIHPAKYLRDNRLDDYTDLIYEGVKKIASQFKNKPVWIRTSDIRTDEYRNLEGGSEEPEESNPMIGWHAIRRSLDEPELLKSEFAALKKLKDEGFENLGVMIPFVISVDEVVKAKEILREAGLEPRKDIAFGIMVETPAAALLIEDFCKEGIDFASIGSNDLTQTILGVDRGNERIAKLYSEFHPAVLKAIRRVIETCKQYAVESSICGQAGSDVKMAELLVRWGIDSISANADAVAAIREVVAKDEKKLMMDAARKESPEN